MNLSSLNNEAIIAALLGAFATALLLGFGWFIRARTTLFRQKVVWSELPSEYADRHVVFEKADARESLIASVAWNYALLEIKSPIDPVSRLILHYSGNVSAISMKPRTQEFSIETTETGTDVIIPSIQSGLYSILSKSGKVSVTDIIRLEDVTAERAIVIHAASSKPRIVYTSQFENFFVTFMFLGALGFAAWLFVATIVQNMQ